MHMKRIFFYFLFSFITTCLFATDYYVSNSGSDGNVGTSQGEAWATLDKVNSVSFNPGDKILFERNGEWFGTITLLNTSGTSGSPITFGAYGSGDNPKIKGSKVIEDTWTQNGNIWSATNTEYPELVTNVVIDDAYMTLARLPKTGYNKITGYNLKTVISDNQLSVTNNYWQDAECAVRTKHWIIDRVPVQSQIGGTITFSVELTYTPDVNYGYFFQNHIHCLTAEGEWIYNTGTKTISLFTSNDPNSRTVEITYFDYIFKIENSNFITIQDIDLSMSRLVDINASSSNNIIIKDVSVSFSGENGIDLNTCHNATIENCILSDINNRGILALNCDNTSITDCTIDNVAMIAGRSKSGNAQGIGVIIDGGDNHLLQYNRITNIGYNGVSFYRGTNTLIQYNYVAYTNMVKDDGAGIYAWGQINIPGNIIDHNIVLYTIGAPEGTPYESINLPATSGLYTDDGSTNISITNNTSAYALRGILLHNSSDIIISGNTTYSNKYDQITYVDHSAAVEFENIETRNNILLCDDGDFRTMYFLEIQDEANNGEFIFEKNYHLKPFTDRNSDIIQSHYGFGNFSYVEWLNSGNEINPISTPILFSESNVPKEDFILFEYNDTKTPKVVPLDGTYRDIDNNIVISDITLEPFTSVILFKEIRTLLEPDKAPFGDTEFCQDSEDTEYITTGVPEGIDYSWSISPNFAGEITGSGKTALVDWDRSFAGTAKVYYVVSGDDDYFAIAPELAIEIFPFPPAPEIPVGKDSLFQGSPNTDYTIDIQDDILYYEWQLLPPEAGTITGLGTVGTVEWGGDFLGDAYISVKAFNDCGGGEFSEAKQAHIGSLKNSIGISTVFTPNGDGINDRWEIPFIQNYPNAVIKIFGRNNKLVVQYLGSDSGWNGMDSSGNLANMGSYLYIIDLKNGTEPLKGYISLIR